MADKSGLEPSHYLLRYSSAFALLVLLVVGAHIIDIVVISDGRRDTEIVNVSGQQRAYLQRIVMLSHRYAETGEPRYRALLEESIDGFEVNHREILRKVEKRGGEIRSKYLDPGGLELDRRSREFVDLGWQLVRAEPGSAASSGISQTLEDIAIVDLLRDLDTAVDSFEAQADARRVKLERLQIAGIVATLLVLLLEIAVILYPAHRAMTSMFKRLQFQAWYDPLTGLANRTRFLARVRAMLDAGPGNRDRIFVMAIDLDGFKDVNDTLGHPAGDQVLQRIAQILTSRLAAEARLEDHVVARIGGDEFLVGGLLKAGDLQAFVTELAEGLISAIDVPIEVSLDEDRKVPCMVGASAGYVLGPGAEMGFDLLLSNADIALYESKRLGKGIATAFRQGLRDTAENRHRLGNELKIGLKQMQFAACFQPQVDLETGRLVGVEALARWDHPTRGLVGPGEFVDIAEQSCLIDALDGQIILDAFGGYRQCQIEGIDLGKLSLNASGIALRDPEFCDLLVQVAAAHDIRPGKIVVEVVESVFIDDKSDEAAETIRKLSRAGIGVAIDDFGVKYSSLSRVAHHGITAIKIDRSLTRQVGTRQMDKILQATVALARGLDLTLLAEGIETEAQRLAMKSLGVEFGQGYLWSPPLHLDDLKSWVRQTQEERSRHLADA